MTKNIYKTAYLSLAVPLSDTLASLQQQICRQYDLIPRSELHMTIAFFGENTARRLIDLASSLLDMLPPPDVAQIDINGLGGAYQIADQIRLIRNEPPAELKECPRVLWLAVAPRDEMRAFRERAVNSAATAGIDTSFNSPDYYPHLTLGSAGPGDQGDWRLWDVHSVAKLATISQPLSIGKVRAAKLHLTDVSIHPDSVHLLQLYPE